MSAGIPGTRTRPESRIGEPVNGPARLRHRPLLAGRSWRASWAARITRSSAFAWGLSVTLHASLFAALYQTAFRETGQTKRDIVPEARLGAMLPSSPSPLTVALRLSERPAPTPARQNVPLRLGEQPGPTPAARQAMPDLAELPLVAVTLEKAPDPLTPTVRSPGPSGPGDVTTGEPAPLTSAIIARGPATEPPSRFFGLTGNAYKVVYVVDLSASLMIYIEDVVRELTDSLQGLIPTQRFHIVLAMPRKVEEFGPRRLVPANGQYKAQAVAFVEPLRRPPEPGKADPIEAMRRAFAVGPELIYFLTDGDYPNIETQLEQELQRLNPHGNVKITVIGFEPSPNPRALLERIAREHGGNCRFVGPK